MGLTPREELVQPAAEHGQVGPPCRAAVLVLVAVEKRVQDLEDLRDGC
jgi:hypothetical protein